MRLSSAPLISTAIVPLACCLVACSTTPGRTAAQRADDAAAAAEVEAVLQADPRIYARHIDIKVRRGVAHLSGYVWAEDELLFARNDAAGVPGIQAVDDQIELMRGGTAGTSR
jgi:osmotically-inducible protein OsmY